MKKALFALILTVIIVFNTTNTFSAEWNYIGYSITESEKIFYVFTKIAGPLENNNIKIEQKHIFSSPEKLSDGREYTSILMQRTLDCTQKTITVENMTLSNGVGTTIESYSNKNGKIKSQIGENQEIDLYLYNINCS